MRLVLASGLKSHLKKGCWSKPQSLAKGTKAAKAKLMKLQDDEAAVTLFVNRLKSVFEFKYLGNLLQADGDPLHAVEVRAGMTKTTFNRLYWGQLHPGSEDETEAIQRCSVVEAHLWKRSVETHRKKHNSSSMDSILGVSLG